MTCIKCSQSPTLCQIFYTYDASNTSNCSLNAWICCSHFYRWRNWDVKGINGLFKVTKKVNEFRTLTTALLSEISFIHSFIQQNIDCSKCWRSSSHPRDPGSLSIRSSDSINTFNEIHREASMHPIHRFEWQAPSHLETAMNTSSSTTYTIPFSPPSVLFFSPS